jgi:hypothetical protein
MDHSPPKTTVLGKYNTIKSSFNKINWEYIYYFFMIKKNPLCACFVIAMIIIKCYEAEFIHYYAFVLGIILYPDGFSENCKIGMANFVLSSTTLIFLAIGASSYYWTTYSLSSNGSSIVMGLQTIQTTTSAGTRSEIPLNCVVLSSSINCYDGLAAARGGCYTAIAFAAVTVVLNYAIIFTPSQRVLLNALSFVFAIIVMTTCFVSIGSWKVHT